MIVVIIRTLILYFATVIALRIMGKKQIGQLQPYQLVVIIMIAELAVIPMENTNIPLVNGIIPIFIIFVAEITLSYMSLRSEKARGIICGKPAVLIENSQIMENELHRLRYNLNDLLEQLRQKDVADLSEVEYAILENSGQLSVILKSQNRPVQPKDLDIFTPPDLLPVSLIIDGRVIKDNLDKLGFSLDWLKAELKRFGIEDFKQVLFAGLDSQRQFIYQTRSSK